MHQDNQAPPLNGIVVLDLSRVLAGPYCTMILAQLGAKVIKVELPGRGDDARAFGPFVNGKSLYFSSLNYDKQSIALNLKESADREIFERLLAISDVLVENFCPGTMEAIGYGWETLHARYPNLIYGAASGFGHSGPYSERPAYDMVVQGMGGVMSLTGQPGNPPTRVGISIGDMGAGLYLTVGLIGALYKRSHGGGAVKVDVAMLDCQVALLENALARYLRLGEISGPQGSRHPEIAPFQVFRTRDSHIVIAAGNDRLFGLLARTLDRADLLDNPDFATNALRREHVDQLESEIEGALSRRATHEWLVILTTAGVPCGPVNSVADVAKDPQVAARDMIISIADPVIGDLKVAGNPIKLSGVAARAEHTPPPAVDADRAAILALLNKADRQMKPA
jgi:CoA:oxalate CoA-transferase